MVTHFSVLRQLFSVFFFNDTPTTEIYTLSLHDALPIFPVYFTLFFWRSSTSLGSSTRVVLKRKDRSEEHTSELQSLRHLVCRLLLEKKNKCRSRLRLSLPVSVRLERWHR